MKGEGALTPSLSTDWILCMYNNKPYIEEPPIARIAQRLALLATYAGMFIVGLVSVTAVTVAYLVPFGWAMMLFASFAFFGTVTGWYRFEWAALPFIITICLIKAVTLWPVTVGFSVWLLFSMAAHMSYRLIYLTIVAKRLRELDEPKIPHV